MAYVRIISLLRRIRDLTRGGGLAWKTGDNGWFTSTNTPTPIHVRFLFYEATNQVGADPRMLEISMPGLNHIFAFGTEGACLLLETLGYADVGYQLPTRGLEHAEQFLDSLGKGSESE